VTALRRSTAAAAASTNPASNVRSTMSSARWIFLPAQGQQLGRVAVAVDDGAVGELAAAVQAIGVGSPDFDPCRDRPGRIPHQHRGFVGSRNHPR
jgi:hypothetical protein